MAQVQQGSVGRVGIPHAVRALLALKVALLVGALKGSTQQRIQVAISTLLSIVFGISAVVVLSLLGNRQQAADAGLIIVLLLPVASIGVGLLSAATGVEATIDARHLATEPLTPAELGIGMLATAMVGPPGVLALLAGVGVFLGWRTGEPVDVVILLVAIVGWLLTMLLLSRTFANALGAWATGRFRQLAQAGATLAALLAWVATQVIANDPDSWDHARLVSLSGVAKWTPPGQLGVAISTTGRPFEALVHLVLGFSWLPLLVWASVASTHRLVLSSPRPGSDGRRMRTARVGLRTSLGFMPAGPVGAIAVRTLRTKLRTPRQAVNTITALVVGAGVFLIGPVFSGGITDGRLVMLGGVLHFAVLFDGNNSFGVDGPALWMEIQAGADARILVRAKALSSIVVMIVPALVIPSGLAAISGGWEWLPAALLLGIGSVLAAAGVSVGTAAIAPVAMPESPNPLASGDTGQGCLAGMTLALGMFVLAVASAPVGLGVLVASGHSALVTTLVALGAPLTGVVMLWAGTRVAQWRLTGRESELVQHITPAR
ncbi:MAG: hypothetical protein WBA45_15910 [Microthrixaceae bacterium]